MKKSDLRFTINNGNITILIKIPDHQPPHVHVYMNSGEEDVILIKGDQERVNIPGYLYHLSKINTPLSASKPRDLKIASWVVLT